MVANKEKLRSYLESENLTAQDFARRLGGRTERGGQAAFRRTGRIRYGKEIYLLF